MSRYIDNLVRMANRIGDFFRYQPEPGDGVAGVATHIEKFWEPRMRRQILDFLSEHPDGVTPGGVVMQDIVRQALTQYRDRLTPEAG